MTADDRTYVLRLLEERRDSLAGRALVSLDRAALALPDRMDLHHRERAHLVSLEAELARVDEVIATVEALP